MKPITHEELRALERGLGPKPSPPEVSLFRKTVMRHLHEEEREEHPHMATKKTTKKPAKKRAKKPRNTARERMVRRAGGKRVGARRARSKRLAQYAEKKVGRASKKNARKRKAAATRARAREWRDYQETLMAERKKALAAAAEEAPKKKKKKKAAPKKAAPKKAAAKKAAKKRTKPKAAPKRAKRKTGPRKPKAAGRRAGAARKRRETIAYNRAHGRHPHLVGPHAPTSVSCVKCGKLHTLREHWSHKYTHGGFAQRNSYACKRGGVCVFEEVKGKQYRAAEKIDDMTTPRSLGGGLPKGKRPSLERQAIQQARYDAVLRKLGLKR